MPFFQGPKVPYSDAEWKYFETGESQLSNSTRTSHLIKVPNTLAHL